MPAYSRPRNGRPVTGQAVERSAVESPGGGYIITHPYYYPYYYPYGYWGSGYGYGFGLGYLYYDPFWFSGYPGFYGGYYDPFYYGGSGYGGSGYGGSGYYGGSGSYGRSGHDTGSLRLKIKPREAQVFIDGYFVGVVDSFDGTFQRLSIDGGSHRVEVKADGYEPIQFEVLVTPGDTVTYKGELKRLQ